MLRQVLLLLIGGTALGVLLALEAVSSARSLLFGLTPNDPATFVSASLFLLVVAIAAGFVPARRASRIDPITALRYE